MKQRIIIGANLGDEGKGTVVAHYTKNAIGKVLNVLTNGGAQRAHSIVTENNESFTFQHFGSGTYHGADSYFSEYFILNPMQFVKELTALRERNVYPNKIYRNCLCRWSTPYDMIANCIIEESRGSHGSCGMGIWETVKRSHINFDKFITMSYIDQIKYLNNVKEYFERDIQIPDHWKDIWNGEFMQTHFIADCMDMHRNTIMVDKLPEDYDEVIYENGQGLMLCDTGKDISGTTPSFTDCRNAVSILPNTDNVTIHYVTRPYLTRHGDGHLEGESNRKFISSDIQEDRTNHYNDNQGEFRFGQLNINDLKSRINQYHNPNFSMEIELTHCDEMDRSTEFMKEFGIVNIYDSPII